MAGTCDYTGVPTIVRRPCELMSVELHRYGLCLERVGEDQTLMRFTLLQTIPLEATILSKTVALFKLKSIILPGDSGITMRSNTSCVVRSAFPHMKMPEFTEVVRRYTAFKQH